MTSVCTVTTLRAPLRETMMFVNYHLNIGVDHMYLFFDDPGDPAAEEWVNNRRVTCVRCDSDYWRDQGAAPALSILERQRVNAGVALAWARRARIEWIAHIDSDELIHAERPVKRLLSDCPSDVQVVKLPTMEAVVDRYEYHRVFEEISLFKVHPGIVGKRLLVSSHERLRLESMHQEFRRRLRLARLLGCTSISEDAYLRGHVLGKSAVRTSAMFDGITCHEPVPSPGAPLRATVSAEARLLHFECRGFDSWRAKWLRLQSIRPDLGDHRRPLLRRFMTVYETNDSRELSAFYRRLYFLSRYERFILSGLGLLKELRLDTTLFEDERTPRLHESVP